MSWATSTADLRTLLSDGPKDRYRFRKKTFGTTDGSNKTFKTLEFRRVTDLTMATAPLGAFVNGVAAAVTTDYPETGEFVLTTAPADGSLVEASYYIQWFLDAELADFLSKSAAWLGLGTVVANVPDGLIPAALKYAASEAYLKMAMRWREQLSAMYRAEDMPDPKQNETVKEFIDMADVFKKEATTLRDHFYTRQGQSLAPLFASVLGNVKDPQPRR